MRRCVALAAVALLAACGGRGGGDREWLANARGVARQLHADVVDVSGADAVPTARAAMHDDSQLYTLLVAYSDFGGCSHEVHALGAPPARFAAAAAGLLRACASLEAATRLFTHAMTSRRAALLARATRTAEQALPALDRALLGLRANT